MKRSHLIVLIAVLCIGVENASSYLPFADLSLSGVVISVDSGDPIANAYVFVYSLSGSHAEIETPPLISPLAAQVKTDGAGRFVVRSLNAGSYFITFEANGYAKQEYGARSFASAGKIIHLQEGDTAYDIRMRMFPTGTVSGTVRDIQRHPLENVQVQLLDPVYNGSGVRTFRLAGMGKTDDNGEFRLFFITPGRYLLSAGTDPATNGILVLGSPPPEGNRVVRKYAYTFYPGVLDNRSASFIEVSSGTPVNSIDFVLPIERSFRVRGKVTNAQTGSPITASLGGYLLYRDGLNSIRSGSGFWSYDSSNGTFEIPGVVPGDYLLEVVLNGGPPLNLTSPEQKAASDSRAGVFIPFSVKDRDYEGLAISPTVGSVHGIIVSDSGSLSRDVLQTIRVEAKPSINGKSASPLWIVAHPTIAQPSDDGSFKIDNLITGEYRIETTVPDYYVREIRYGSTDLLRNPLSFMGADSRRLTIVLSPKTGTIRGTALNPDGKGSEFMQIVLMPQNSDRTDLYRFSTTDSSGRFAILNAAPGVYSIFAWDPIRPYGFFDEEFSKISSGRVQTITVKESAVNDVTLSTIFSGTQP